MSRIPVGNALNAVGGVRLQIESVLAWVTVAGIIVFGLLYAFTDVIKLYNDDGSVKRKPSKTAIMLCTSACAACFTLVALFSASAAKSSGKYARLYRQASGLGAFY